MAAFSAMLRVASLSSCRLGFKEPNNKLLAKRSVDLGMSGLSWAVTACSKIFEGVPKGMP